MSSCDNLAKGGGERGESDVEDVSAALLCASAAVLAPRKRVVTVGPRKNKKQMLRFV